MRWDAFAKLGKDINIIHRGEPFSLPFKLY